MPFFVRDVGYHDEILAVDADDGDYLVFKAVSKRSGYSTIRLWIGENESLRAVTSWFVDRACLVEFAPNFANRLIAVAIPQSAFEEVDSYIASEKGRGRWDVQDGYLANRE